MQILANGVGKVVGVFYTLLYWIFTVYRAYTSLDQKIIFL